MQPLKRISLDQLVDYHQKLKQFSHLNEYNIRDIWKLSDEVTVDDLHDLKYHSNSPLYQKMIFRFRHSDRITSKFYRGLDPYNQEILLTHFNMNRKEYHDYIEFFAWISNGLSIVEINKMDHDGVKDYKSSDYVQRWKRNDIEFFFWLPTNQQKSLIGRYNRECVDRFNEMIKDDHDDDIYYYT